jgi:signal peptidase I
MKTIARPILAALGRLLSGHVVVRGDSMLPGLRAGHYLMVDRMAYVLRAPKRGDVVVVKGEGGGPTRHLKRVVGLPGEEVAIGEGRVSVGGSDLNEPYLAGRPAASGLEEGRWNVSEEEVFVLGDNRMASTDSRGYGPVARARIEGRAWLRYWPLARFSRIGGRSPKR